MVSCNMSQTVLAFGSGVTSPTSSTFNKGRNMFLMKSTTLPQREWKMVDELTVFEFNWQKGGDHQPCNKSCSSWENVKKSQQLKQHVLDGYQCFVMLCLELSGSTSCCMYCRSGQYLIPRTSLLPALGFNFHGWLQSKTELITEREAATACSFK